MTRASLIYAACLAALVQMPAAAQVTGQGTTGFVPKWTGSTTLGNSNLYALANGIGIGTTKPAARLDVRGGGTAPAIHARGGNPQPGSDRSGTDGVDARGGDADVDSGVSSGGTGVVGVGGSESQLGGGAGTGGYFQAGRGTAGSTALVANCNSQPNCFAGYFEGDVNVLGTLTAATKNFRIDHPLDPAHKFLQHAAVESSEMKNIYDGTATLDAQGRATVQLPAWFEAENGSFRYQLTLVGAPSPDLYIAQKMRENRFGIAGGTPGVEISWMVTGVRHDAYALAHPLVVEPAKSERVGDARRLLLPAPAAFLP